MTLRKGNFYSESLSICFRDCFSTSTTGILLYFNKWPLEAAIQDKINKGKIQKKISPLPSYKNEHWV